MEKVDLRRRMRLTRDLISDRVLRSVALWGALAEHREYVDALVVMAFVGGPGEPDTDSLFARLRADGKTLVLPAVEGDRLVARLVGPGLRPGAFGIDEPQGEPVALTSLDLVLVPGVAFTPDGRRLGRGGGHYDRFLAALPPACPTIGVCFAEQLVDDLPMEAHDRLVGSVLAADDPGDLRE
jgi:5-formyltetrahydrofolate cyclo-ligase